MSNDKSGIIETQDGSHSIFSEQFDVSYHSKYGAIQESRHVFIDAGLRHQISRKKDISVLDIGFGTGLNALLTYLETRYTAIEITYEAVEAYPLDLTTALSLNYPEILGIGSDNTFHKLHSSEWETLINISETFSFKKRKQFFQDVNDQQKFDVIYFDAFAPNSQPELWEAPLLTKMYAALKNNGILVTYCAKGAVKRALKSIGFTVESLPGPPGKREMTRGMKILT
jgi:tRNA U34 5-methylaminomethyl-2-thiouridine-forming methyltransferase MnmC